MVAHGESSVIPYPWNDIERNGELLHDGALHLFVYGSLMNAESAAVTLPASTPRPTPVIASGIRRVFNRGMADAASSRYGRPPSARYSGVLNVERSSVDDQVNGLLQRIEIGSIRHLREREIGYGLIRVPVVDWATGSPLCLPTFALSTTVTNDSLLPHPGYLKVCAEGARRVSARFLEMFRRTTFFGRGIPLSDPAATIDALPAH